jgi:phosphoribosylglycinamide formyltransferase 1
MRKKLGVLLSGRGSNFEAIAASIEAGRLDAEIAVVLSNRPEARGLEIARDRGLNAVSIPSKGLDREVYDRMVVAELNKNAADLVCLAGYMRLLSAYFVREFPLRKIGRAHV